MITVRQAAQKWGVNCKTVQRYAMSGRIPGACYDDKGQWQFPDDAKKPEPKRPGRKPAPPPELVPEEPEPVQPVRWRMDPEETVEYIKKNCMVKSYKQLRQETGLPCKEIRRIYEHLHEAYGI